MCATTRNKSPTTGATTKWSKMLTFCAVIFWVIFATKPGFHILGRTNMGQEGLGIFNSMASSLSRVVKTSIPELQLEYLVKLPCRLPSSIHHFLLQLLPSGATTNPELASNASQWTDESTPLESSSSGKTTVLAPLGSDHWKEGLENKFNRLLEGFSAVKKWALNAFLSQPDKQATKIRMPRQNDNSRSYDPNCKANKPVELKFSDENYDLECHGNGKYKVPQCCKIMRISKTESCVDGNDGKTSTSNGQKAPMQGQASGNRAAQCSFHQPANARSSSDSSGDGGGGDGSRRRANKRIGGCMNSDVNNAKKRKDGSYSATTDQSTPQQVYEESLGTSGGSGQSHPSPPPCLRGPTRNSSPDFADPQPTGANSASAEDQLVDYSSEDSNHEQLFDAPGVPNQDLWQSRTDYVDQVSNQSEGNRSDGKGSLPIRQCNDCNSERHGDAGSSPAELLDTGQCDGGPWSDSQDATRKGLSRQINSSPHTSVEDPPLEQSTRRADARSNDHHNPLQEDSRVSPSDVPFLEPNVQDPLSTQLSHGTDGGSNASLAGGQAVSLQPEPVYAAQHAVREMDLRPVRGIEVTRRNRTFDHPPGVYSIIVWQCHAPGCDAQHSSRMYQVPYCNDCGRSYCLDCNDRHQCLRVIPQAVREMMNRTFHDPAGHYGRRLWICHGCGIPCLSDRFTFFHCQNCGREFCLDCDAVHVCRRY